MSQEIGTVCAIIGVLPEDFVHDRRWAIKIYNRWYELDGRNMIHSPHANYTHVKRYHFSTTANHNDFVIWMNRWVIAHPDCQFSDDNCQKLIQQMIRHFSGEFVPTIFHILLILTCKSVQHVIAQNERIGQFVMALGLASGIISWTTVIAPVLFGAIACIAFPAGLFIQHSHTTFSGGVRKP